MTELSRREFMVSAALSVLGPRIARAELATDVPWSGERIVDCHFHGRGADEAIFAHLDGAGITSAVCLVGNDYSERIAAIRKANPTRPMWWARGPRLVADPADTPVNSVPAAAQEMLATAREAIKKGAKGFGETAGVVAVDGPELRRLYALAAELDVPVMMHFQVTPSPGQPRYGITDFSRIEAMLKQFPRTRFVCHASDFWGHIDATYKDGDPFPSGKVNRGGLADRLLGQYPNMFGDLGAPSGLIQISRDLEFTSDFLKRHQNKLMFGSDCACLDGRGGMASPAGAASVPLQTALAARSGLAGKCVAREILGVLWKTTQRDVFRKLVWQNANRVYKLGA
jgi:predicted TIM-barrel fold metal-dependent hydrolase